MTQIGTAYVEVKGDLTQLQADVASALAPAKLGKFGKVAGVAMGGALAAGVGAAIAGKIAYDLGAEFDAAFDKIRINTGKTGKPLEKLKKDFKAVFASVPTDATTAADAIAGLNKRLDLSGKPLRNLSKNMLELSRMTETDLTGNIQSITRLFGDWSIETAKQVPTLNELWRASQKTGVNIKDLSDLMVQFGSPLRNLGFDFDTAAAMFSKFEKEGVNIQTAMPGLRMALKNFAGAGKDPQKALEETFKAIDQAGSTAEANTLAFEVFGTRAGPDLAAAIREGRFEFDNIERSMRKGKDTIMRSSKDTRDLGENMQIFGNKLKVIFEPLGTLVFNSVGKISEALAGLPIRKWSADVQRFVKHNEDFKSVLTAVKNALKVLGAVAKVAWGIMKDQFKAAWGYLKSGLLALKGLVRIVSGVFTGDWSKAWSGVKQLFRGSVGIVLNIMRAMTAPLRAVTKLLGKALSSVFGGAWDRVKDIFESGADAIMGIVKKIIDVINLIPGVPDIHIGGSVGDEGSANVSVPGGHATRRQRGGVMVGGKPTGDSIPAILERGEYVLNREAVKQIGVDALNHLNFKQARRFQSGGPIGLSVGGAISDVAGMAADGLKNLPGGGLADMAGKALGKGAGWFVGQLPKPNLPVPFTDLGPYLIDQVTEWIKSHAPNVGGALGSMPGDLGKAMALAQQHGLSITSTTGGTHAPGSYHYSGRAFDASNGTNTPEERSYFLDAASRWGGKMLELFYDPIGWYIKNGSKVPGAIGGHSDHVHTAMQRGGFVGLMRGGAAEKGGLVKHPWFDKATKKGNINGVWPSADLAKDPNAWYNLPTLPGYVFGALAEAAGRHYGVDVPGRAMMQMVLGEGGTSNGGKPGSQGTDPGGASKGYGPWALTTNVGNEKLAASLGGFKKQNNPVLNAAAMAQVFKTNGLGAWYGQKYVTDPNADWRGSYQLRNALGGDSYNTALRAALGGKYSEDSGESAGDKAKAQNKARREAREKQVKALIRKAFTADSPVAKKGAFWQVLDLYAKYGDFDYRPGTGTAQGGFAPGRNEKGIFLSRAAEIASIANPNRGSGQLYNLVKWLEGNVDLTGAEDADDHFSERLAKVKKKGGARAAGRRESIYSRLAGLPRAFRFTNPLGEADRKIEFFGELADVAEQKALNPAGPGGSEYTDTELAGVVGQFRKVLGWQSRKKNLLDVAIPFASDWIGTYRREVKRTSDPGSVDHWKLPGFKQGLSQLVKTLGVLRSGRKALVGVTGEGGELFQTKQRLLELGVQDTVEKQAAAGISISGLREIVEAASLGVYNNLPMFHSGGIFRAPPGQVEGPALLRDGETIRTVEQERALGRSPVVEVTFADGMGWLREFMDVRIAERERAHDQFAKAGGV